MPRIEDIVLASSMLEGTSNDSFVKIHKEVIKPSISEIKKEESLTPPDLAEQYELDFTQYLECSSYLGKQSFFSMSKNVIKVEQILQEHSYFKKKILGKM